MKRRFQSILKNNLPKFLKSRTGNDLRRYELESTGIVNAIKPNWCEAVESAAEVWFLQMHEAALQILLGIFCQHGGDECKYYGGQWNTKILYE
jgi:hypothetical protein